MAFDALREPDPRKARIRAVRQALDAHSLAAEVTGAEPVCSITGPRQVAIRCDYTTDIDDSGGGRRLWLFDDATGEPIAQADAEHLHEVIRWAQHKATPRI